jgi:hypothetical protein
MSRLLSLPAVAGAILALACLGAAQAQAQEVVTFVSGKGVDSGACAPQSSPCRTFRFALTKTLPGGEIKALDPDNYGFVSITQAVSITGVEGASINTANGAPYGIRINTGDVVNISNLILDGRKNTSLGILISSGGLVTIKNCVVRNFMGAGINTEGGTLLLSNSTVTTNDVGVALGGSAQSAGNNLIVDNPGGDVVGGSLTNVGTK